MSINENAQLGSKGEFDTTYNNNTMPYLSLSQDVSMPLFCSGYGQYHTNESGKKARKPYLQIDLAGIRQLVDNPQQVDKSQSQWLIPSTLLSRTFKEQEKDGEFYLLWADIDMNPSGVNAIAETIEDLLPGCDYEIYTSKSATEENRKCRVLIPSKPLFGFNWVICQEILNDKLQEKDITPDRKSEGAAQLCYLPNQGMFYDTRTKRSAKTFDPMLNWIDEIRYKREEIERQANELEKSKSDAKSKRDAFNSYNGTDAFPSLIDAFNDAYTVEDILLQTGYDKKGNTYRHPNSESGSFSASVRDDRVYSLSSSDPLYTGMNSGGAHDAFSAFTVLFHNVDRDAALKDAGENWVMIGAEYWNKVKQREHAQQSDNAGFEKFSDERQEKEQEVFSLKIFDVTGNVDDMRQRMKDDVFVMDGIALLGQITALYASPNTGKTLLTIKMLIDSVKEGRINGEDIYYINADDTCKGIITKVDIIKSHKINMIVPDHKDFKAKDFVKYLNQLIKDDTASGVIVVLDTLKKFSDLMDKRSSSQFMTAARSFVSHGGTLIMLAHTNKRRDADNKLIAGGTSDVIDDADCAYIIDAKPPGLGDTRKTVIFENIKSRGNVERELCFSYSIQQNQTYASLLDSVEKHSQSDLDATRKEIEATKALEKDSLVIEIIEEIINNGTTKKTDLVKEVNATGGGSQSKVRIILDRYTGKRWGVLTDSHNTKTYHLIGKTTTAEDYTRAKDGY
ncbi:hypothetical protein [Nitrosomonas sp.]|uniref:hypothetical protein n=1 Tax=Nitrosomonas sp. TaxID=42353 RepID=UPI0025D25259|nr:hypothetical protein [Nitrosomonas sp.]